MSIDRANDPAAFRAFLDVKLADAPVDFTLDDALAQWEVENRGEDDHEETRRAILEGLADVDAGRTRPLGEFEREFRARRGLPARR